MITNKNVHTSDTASTLAYIATDAVYMCCCISEGKGNSSPTREPDGIE